MAFQIQLFSSPKKLLSCAIAMVAALMGNRVIAAQKLPLPSAPSTFKKKKSQRKLPHYTAPAKIPIYHF